MKTANNVYEKDNSLKTYVNEIKDIPILTRSQEVALFKEYYKGSLAAKEKLIKANLRFVVSVAKKYKVTSMSLMDLINEGNIGLITAIEKFDISRNVNFISYGVWWIRQSILKAISEQSRMIRVPANISNSIVKINKHNGRLSQALGRTPTVDELASDTDLTRKEVNDYLDYSKECTSLEKRIDPDSDDEIQYFVKGPQANEPQYQVESDSLKSEINKVLETLTEKEKEVIICRFGLNDKAKESLETIGARFGVSKERIRQIEEKALKNLRSFSRRERLSVYMQEH